jgi:hypothetical protein
MSFDWIDLLLLCIIVAGLAGAAIALGAIAVAEIRERRAIVRSYRTLVEDPK